MQVKIIERSLQFAERGLEAWRFLFVLASSVLLSLPLVFLFGSAQEKYVLNFDFGVVVRTFAGFGIIASIFFLTCLASCRRAAIISGACLFLLSTIVMLLLPFTDHLLLAYKQALNPFDFLLAVLLITAAVYFLTSAVIRSVSALVKALGAKVDSRLLKTDSSYDLIRGVLGIPGSTRWIKSRLKRFGIYSLFGLSQITFALLTITFFTRVLTRPLYYQNHNLHVACLPLFFPELSKTPGWIPVPSAGSTLGEGQCLEASASLILMPVFALSFLFLLTVSLRTGARRSSRLSLQAVRENDHRGPILFLRSFLDDQVRLRPSERSVFRRLVLCGEPRPFLDHVLLEEGIRIGPIVAIGAPGKRPPFGIPRTYVSDSSWQTVVADFGKEATAIAIVVDETEGVGWELEYIASHKLGFKTLFLIPPKFTSPQVAIKLFTKFLSLSGRDPSCMPQDEEFFSRCPRLCIGWLTLPDGNIEVITSATASETAYRVAIRYFLEVNINRDGAVQDDADLSSDFADRNELGVEWRRRVNTKLPAGAAPALFGPTSREHRFKPVTLGLSGLLIGAEMGAVVWYWTQVDHSRLLEICDDLKNVIAEGRASRFNSILGRDGGAGGWTARIDLLGWHDCEINEFTLAGETGIGRSYSCTFDTRYRSAAEIRAKTEAVAAHVKPCLGSEWAEQRSTSPDQTISVSYVPGRDDPVVVLREAYNEERKDWALQLYVHTLAKGRPQN